MAEKLQIGDKFPALEVKLLDGSTFNVLDDMTGRYLVLLFYRGHW